MASARWRPLTWVAAVLLVPVALLASPLALFVAAPLVAAFHDRPAAHPVPFAAGTGPGSVVSARTMPDLAVSLRARQLHAARVEYRSTGAHGEQTVVSGSVFAPRGDPPAGGWPVIALAHGSTGILRDCAPSLAPDLLGSAALVEAYTRLGYAVALPDYQGLGAGGAHRYLDAAVAGRNLVDAVRALRAVFPPVSTRWLAAGLSQGGAAAWSANEQAATYGRGLELVGSVSISPAADMTGLATRAADGTLPASMRPLLQWVLASAARTEPAFDLDDYRSGTAAADWATLSSCGRDHAVARVAAARRLGPRDLQPRTPAAAARLTALLRARALPQRPASAPMLVVYGSADAYVDPAWTTAAVGRARALGDEITADLQPGRGHLDVDTAQVQPWIDARFR
jgi:hypothetical protein